MKKALLLLMIAFFKTGFMLAQCELCKEATFPVYNTLKVQTDKEAIQTLYSVYHSTRDQYENTQKKEGFSAIIPNYGSAEYEANKTKIKTIHSRIDDSTAFELTQNERMDLLSQTISDNVRIAQLNAFTQCIANCNGKPYLAVADLSEQEATIILHLPLTPRNAGKKTKIKNIQLSPGLTLSDTSKYEGEPFLYGESPVFIVKRETNEAKRIAMNLKKENAVSVQIPKFVPEKIMRPKWFSTAADGKELLFKTPVITIQPEKKTKLGAKKGWNGARKKVSYMAPGVARGTIDLKLSPQSHKADRVRIDLISGAVGKIGHNIVVKNNSLHLEYTVPAALAQAVSFRLEVPIEELRMVCVANCP